MRVLCKINIATILLGFCSMLYKFIRYKNIGQNQNFWYVYLKLSKFILATIKYLKIKHADKSVSKT